MAEILGIGVSHYPGLLVPPDQWTRMLPRNVSLGRVPAELYQDRSRWPADMLREWGDDEGVAAACEHERRLVAGYREMRRKIDEFAPHAVLIWGDDQYENFRNECVPAFCVYMFDEMQCRPYGGGRRPFQSDQSSYGVPLDTQVRVRGHADAAAGLCRHLLDHDFDIAYATEARADSGLAHSFNNTLVFLDRDRRGFDYPLIPFHVNCYGNQLMRGARPDLSAGKVPRVTPPAPSPRRCFDIGRATARYFADSPWRVALIASSSWSHASLTEKHHGLYPDLPADRRLHEDLLNGRFDTWGGLPLAGIEDAGQHEVLNWVCLAGAMTELGRRAHVVDYVESNLFNSSKCFATFEPEAQEQVA
jgi:hypothetical protein